MFQTYGTMPNSSPIYLEVEDIFAVGAEQQSRRKSSAKEPSSMNYTNRAITSFVDSVCKMNEAVLVPSKLRDIEVRDCDATSLLPPSADLYSVYQMLNTVRQDLFSNSKYQGAFLPSGANSGQNSGRVSPTGSLSRRSSSIGMYGGATSPVQSPTTPLGNGRTLAPPSTLFLERKLSSSSSRNGDASPDLMSSSTHSNGNYLSPTSPSPVPLSFGSRSTSLSNMMAAIGLDDSEPSSSEERAQQVASCFVHHLNALYSILGHFTRGANYITRRYQEETEDLF